MTHFIPYIFQSKPREKINAKTYAFFLHFLNFDTIKYWQNYFGNFFAIASIKYPQNLNLYSTYT